MFSDNLSFGPHTQSQHSLDAQTSGTMKHFSINITPKSTVTIIPQHALPNDLFLYIVCTFADIWQHRPQFS